MSHSLAKKVHKIVSKLGSKHSDAKSNGSDTHTHHDESAADGHGDSHHESTSKLKGHSHGVAKGDHVHPAEGAPPQHVIADDLRDSPFKGKRHFRVNVLHRLSI
jgi:hypothetical protein